MKEPRFGGAFSCGGLHCQRPAHYPCEQIEAEVQNILNRVFAECATTLDELRRDPDAVPATAGDEAVAILDQDKPAAYLISADAFEKLLERLDDAELAEVVRQRLPDLDQAVDVTLDEL